MQIIPSILADNFNGYGKLIGLVVVGIFWGIQALSSMAKKANEQARRNAAMRPTPVTPPAQSFQQSAPAAQRSVQQNEQLNLAHARNQLNIAQQAKQRKAATKRAAIRPPQPAPPALPPMQNAPVSRAGATTAPKPASTPSTLQPVRAGGANAATIRRWLQPGTIRKQFILTELFQPALALREPRKP